MGIKAIGIDSPDLSKDLRQTIDWFPELTKLDYKDFSMNSLKLSILT